MPADLHDLVKLHTRAGVGCAKVAEVTGRIVSVSPTIFRDGPFRFYFFSREESRMHVHVHATSGEAKFWLEPRIELDQKHGLSMRQVITALRVIQEHEDEIRKAGKTHFGR